MIRRIRIRRMLWPGIMRGSCRLRFGRCEGSQLLDSMHRMRGSRLEGGGEFFVDVAEATVGEDGDYVVGGEAWGEVGDDGVGVGAHNGGNVAGVERGDDVLRIEALEDGDGFAFEDGR